MSKRSSHLRVVAQAEFDPTPEEKAKAERAVPTKRPLCIKCKASYRIAVWETVKHRINEGFLAISAILLKEDSGLSRQDIASLRSLHDMLCRASKARYCTACVAAVTAHVRDTLPLIASRPRP